MGVFGTIKLEGGAELDRKLRELPKALARKILRTALREGAKPIQANAKTRVHSVSGLTVKAIKVRAIKRNRKGVIGIRLSISEGDYKGETFYASFLEYGWHGGARKNTEVARANRITSELRKETRKKKVLAKMGTERRKLQEAFFYREGARKASVLPKRERTFHQFPFLRPAFDAKKGEAVRVIADSIGRGIEEAAKTA